VTLTGVGFWLSLISSDDLICICSHDYPPLILVPNLVDVFGQLRDIDVDALESFGRHCVGRWCFQWFEGLPRAGGL
jgi:hypothetical protein